MNKIYVTPRGVFFTKDGKLRKDSFFSNQLKHLTLFEVKFLLEYIYLKDNWEIVISE